ncbi:DegT/DnrJ/EryC1/StrS family aminotransferase [Candidatus Dependentiae bacterium]|nr:DegT/DnrJ/EryC1/StrS family aminotransferase [Candidatus Dependentiae bacterium]
MKVIFGLPYIVENDIDEIVDSLNSGWLGKGPKTAQFERSFANYIGISESNTVGLNSCTAGLFIALKGMGIGSGDEVIVPAMTFAATANVVENIGAKTVFADVFKNNGTIIPEEIEKKITSKTKAVIPVHYCGYPCKMDEICRIARKYKIAVIEDAAHSIEGIYNGKHLGLWGDAASFSFYATKNITTGDGGMLLTKNKKLADFARLYSTQGLSADAWKRQSSKKNKCYEVVIAGMKFNMIDLQAALGLHQFEQIEKYYKIRLNQWKTYCSELKNTGLIMPKLPENRNSRHSLHLFTILIDKKNCGYSRDDFQKALTEKGIGTGIHFISLHNHKFYKQKYDLKKSDYPFSDYISENTLSLPIGPSLKNNEQEYIIDTIKKCINN